MESSGTSPPSPPPSNRTAFPQRTLEAVDIVVLVLYFVFVLAVGLWVRRAASRAAAGHTRRKAPLSSAGLFRESPQMQLLVVLKNHSAGSGVG